MRRPKTTGRTRLLGAGAIILPDIEEQASEPPGEPHQKPQERAHGREWDADDRHDGCGGEVRKSRGGTALWAVCGCGREWRWNGETKRWERC